MITRRVLFTSFGATAILWGIRSARGAEVEVFPGKRWERRSPAEVRLDSAKLDALAKHVGGNGCVVRRGFLVFTWGDPAKSGDVASACKPVLSTLLMIAIQEGKLKGADDPVADVEPRLKEINGGKDATITWRHLASQTSGYGLVERPGEAYSYNDYALALYYDSLTRGVFKEEGTALLKRYFAGPLGFEDACTFEAFGAKDRPGRLALSVRDFARFGLMYLRGGRWGERRIVREDLVRTAIASPIPADTRLTSGKESAMIPGQRTIGGTRNITPDGPGQYSFNWWVNRKDARGELLYEDLPGDAFIASGHGGIRQLTMVPSWELVVCWNDSRMKREDKKVNRAAVRLVREAVRE
jgi:CubicO group peptidase (beta-lactamase class C family)